jgi:hypothetical protein
MSQVEGSLVDYDRRSMAWQDVYARERGRLLADLDRLVAIEKAAFDLLAEVTVAAAPRIARDWQHATDVLPHWIEMAPKQRGRGSSGLGIPWLEVSERVPLANVTAELTRRYGEDVRFPGLPAGGDLRFAVNDIFVHFDAKAAGPNDLHDEVVVPPYQVSGDGKLIQGLLAPQPTVKNTVITFRGRTSKLKEYTFYPLLPPLYAYDDGTALTCITAFVEVVYDVHSLGNQPLKHLTLVVVPNGLLLFHAGLIEIPGLFARGKDDNSKPLEDHRVRIRFPELAAIAPWRVTKIAPDADGTWSAAEGTW